MKTPKTSTVNPKRPTALPPAHGSAALLNIIRECEQFQNLDTGEMTQEEVDDVGYKLSMKIITIANAGLQELQAQQNAPAHRAPDQTL